MLKAAIESDYISHINLVFVGEDEAVLSDFSSEIAGLCDKYEIGWRRAKSGLVNLGDDPEAVLLAAGWRWIIRGSFGQIIVFHDSLLPKYRGFNPLVTALLNKDPEVGVTALVANEQFDTGDIVEQQSVKIYYPIKVSEAIELVGEAYCRIACSIFHRLSKGRSLAGYAQDHDVASYSVWRDEDDYRIDWSWTAEYIGHFVNCVSYPYKGASSFCDQHLVRIQQVENVPDVDVVNRDVGKVLFMQNGQPIVICGEGLVRIVRATYESGGSLLPASKFRLRFR